MNEKELEELKYQFVRQLNFIKSCIGTYNVEVKELCDGKYFDLSITLFIYGIGDVLFTTRYDEHGVPLNWIAKWMDEKAESRYGLQVTLFELGVKADRYYEQELKKVNELKPVGHLVSNLAMRCWETWRK